MKFIKKTTIIISIFLFFITGIIYNRNYTIVNGYSISSGEIVIEQTTNRVLFEHNPDKKLPMASTTKIITCITAIENCNLNDVVTVSKAVCGIEGSSIYLKEGDKYTVLDLLYGLMLRSGNDCAEAIALHVGKTRENFIKMMNSLAKKAGALNTNLINPHGLHDDKHYTTARDLALITSYAMQNDTFKKIISTKKIVVTELSANEKRVFTNKNKMLSGFEGSNGVKTGYTTKAGRCLVSSALRNEMQLICVTLNSPQMFERSSELLSKCFDEYEMRVALKKDDFENKTKIKGAENSTFALTVSDDVKIPCKDGEKVETRFNLPEKTSFTKNKGDIIGKIDFYIENNLIFSQKIYTIESINSISYFNLLKILLKNYFAEGI